MPIQPKQQPPYYTTETPVKTYIAILNQSGTNPPIANVLVNTFNGEITWTYEDVGFYLATLNSAFPADKTWIMVAQSPIQNFISAIRSTNNTIDMQTLDSTGSNMDGLLDDTAIEIRVIL